MRDDQLLIWVFLLALTSPYWLTPLIIRRMLTDSANPEFEVIELTDLPADFMQKFHDAGEQLSSCGFARFAIVKRRKQGLLWGMDGYVSIWANEVHTDSTQVIGVGVRSRNQSSASTGVMSVTYRTEFTDGTAIHT